MILPVGRIFDPSFSGRSSALNPSISSSTAKTLKDLAPFFPFTEGT